MLSQTVSLLAKRGSFPEGLRTDFSDAVKRSKTTKWLAENYEAFEHIRRRFMGAINTALIDAKSLPIASEAMITKLADLKFMQRVNDNRFKVVEDDDARRYLAGGWLEELTWLAVLEAGADDALLSQILTSRRKPHKLNEIDVIAKVGQRLYFISCKAYRLLPEHYGKNSKPLNKAAKKIRRMAQLYGQRDDRAVLVTTTDLFKGRSVRKRLAYLNLFCRRNKVGVLGFELLSFDEMVGSFKKLFEANSVQGLVQPEQIVEPKLTTQEGSNKSTGAERGENWPASTVIYGF